MMKRLASALALISAACLSLALITPGAAASAALNTADTSFPIDDVTQLEMHTTANCVRADNRCYFHAGADLRTPDGPTGFPPGLWARQTTTLRSSDRLNYLDSDYDAPNTRIFRSIGPVELTTIYFGEGPVEKYQINGYTRTTDWGTGQPKTDADYIVCAQIQVVYPGVNITSPSTCAQTTYS
jgi:hypothetical protein